MNKNNCKYKCECCKYYTKLKKCYDAHIITQKHILKSENKIDTPFECPNCKKPFQSNSGLWRHKKKCNTPTIINNNITNNNTTNNITNNNNNINNTNITINNNINIFLNETCKNALNLNEFIALLKIQMADLDKIYNAITNAEYAKAVGQLIIKNNNRFSIHERPLHCIKETGESVIHFKEENEWKKEDYREQTPRLDNMVDTAINHAILKIPEIVGEDNSVKYRYKQTRKRMVKNHGNKSLNKKIVKDIADGITIATMPVALGNDASLVTA